MEVDPTRMCELLVGLPAVTVLGVVDEHDAPIVVHVETRDVRPSCATSTTQPCLCSPAAMYLARGCSSSTSSTRIRPVSPAPHMGGVWVGDRLPIGARR